MSEQLIIFAASKLHIVIAGIAVVYFLFAETRKKITMMILGATALPLSYVLGKIVGMLWQTQRPFATMNIPPMVDHIADNGFPSEHTLYALVIAGVIYVVHKKIGVVLIVLAILVGLGRVLAYVHNPVDIFGSVVLALVVFSMLGISVCKKTRIKIEMFLYEKLQQYFTKS